MTNQAEASRLQTEGIEALLNCASPDAADLDPLTTALEALQGNSFDASEEFVFDEDGPFLADLNNEDLCVHCKVEQLAEQVARISRALCSLSGYLEQLVDLQVELDEDEDED